MIGIKNLLIKALGGYTQKEYNKILRENTDLINSRTTIDTSYIANIYIDRILKDLYMYAKNELYGKSGNEWANKMFKIIKFNMIRNLVFYVHTRSSSIYRLNTNLEDYHEILEQERDSEEDSDLFILENE